GDHLPARFGYELVMEDDVDRTALKTTDALLEAMKALRARHAIAAEQPFLKMAGAAVSLRYRQAQDGAAIDTTPVEPVLEAYPRYAFADRVVRTTSMDEMVELQRGMDTVA